MSHFALFFSVPPSLPSIFTSALASTGNPWEPPTFMTSISEVLDGQGTCLNRCEVVETSWFLSRCITCLEKITQFY